MTSAHTFPPGHLNIGTAIRAVRRRAGLTQEQLAERVGVRQSAVSQWETGYSIPGYDQEERVELALGLTPGELRRLAQQSPRLDQRRRPRTR